MTTPRIEEMVEQLFQYYDDIDCAVTVDQRITAKEQAELWLTRVITEAHQAGVDEMVHEWNKAEKKLDGTAQGVVNCIEYYRETIKALQDNK